MTENYSVAVDVEIVDNRTNIKLSQPKNQNLDYDQIRAILSGGVALAIRASKDEVAAMKETIDYLNSEFVNSDSFKDINKV
jgi:cell division GTPase FtsZ